MSFDRVIDNEFPHHSGCYWILGTIIEEEVAKKQEGMGLNQTEFLTKLCDLSKLVFMIEKSWNRQKRTPQQFADYFNVLVKKEMKLNRQYPLPALYSGFLKRWNKRHNPGWKVERFVESFNPDRKRRKVSFSSEDSIEIELTNTVVQPKNQSDTSKSRSTKAKSSSSKTTVPSVASSSKTTVPSVASSSINTPPTHTSPTHTSPAPTLGTFTSYPLDGDLPSPMLSNPFSPSFDFIPFDTSLFNPRTFDDSFPEDTQTTLSQR
jgi:hypothetical protein